MKADFCRDMAQIFLSYIWITSSVFIEGEYQKFSLQSRCS